MRLQPLKANIFYTIYAYFVGEQTAKCLTSNISLDTSTRARSTNIDDQSHGCSTKT